MITLMLLIVLTSITRHRRALIMMGNTFVNLYVRVKCVQIKKGKVYVCMCIHTCRLVDVSQISATKNNSTLIVIHILSLKGTP